MSAGFRRTFAVFVSGAIALAGLVTTTTTSAQTACSSDVVAADRVSIGSWPAVAWSYSSPMVTSCSGFNTRRGVLLDPFGGLGMFEGSMPAGTRNASVRVRAVSGSPSVRLYSEGGGVAGGLVVVRDIDDQLDGINCRRLNVGGRIIDSECAAEHNGQY